MNKIWSSQNRRSGFGAQFLTTCPRVNFLRAFLHLKLLKLVLLGGDQNVLLLLKFFGGVLRFYKIDLALGSISLKKF